MIIFLYSQSRQGTAEMYFPDVHQHIGKLAADQLLPAKSGSFPPTFKTNLQVQKKFKCQKGKFT